MTLKWIVPLGLLLTIGLSACGGATTTTITVAGSTTVQPLAQKLADEFMKKHPDATINVLGGGSNIGIRSAATGIVDIGTSSRELRPEDPKLVKHLLATDLLAILVHPSNPVSGLSKEQVKEIFAGNIVNWKEVGGEDKEIHVAAREEAGGTRDAFDELVMGGKKEGLPITKRAILQQASGAIRLVVAGDPQAISFLSLGYLDSTVKALAINGVAATQENAQAGKYPITRPLFFLTREAPAGLVEEFIDFSLGDEGQGLVEQEGYIRVK